jgi:hypothetical protein
MNHWQLLSLEPDADERGIKRAYARLLKTHRPDENPEAFQRLREAYEAALAETRWRVEADDEVVYVTSSVSTPSLASEEAAQVSALELVDTSTAVEPPEPALGQMQQWLTEGKDREVMDGIRRWLASDWLLPFERREQFEQCVLDWLESDPNTSHVFFDGVCQAMGWDEAQGNLPCEYWRWNRLIQRCETQAMAQTVRAELARFEADKLHGQAAALLLNPLPDHRRRAMADSFTSLDWQRFTDLAQAIEYQYPEVPQHLGLQPLDNWRDWLPADSYRGVYLFLWLALSAVLIASMFTGKNGLEMTVLMPLMMLSLIWIGMKAYYVWSLLAVAVGQLDVDLSRWLLPRSWYRQSAGLLLIRHILPSAVPAALACIWSGSALWLQWTSPVVVFVGVLYFTSTSLSGGKLSMWARASRALKRMAARLPWHLLKRESVLVVIAVAVMAASVYFRSNGL